LDERLNLKFKMGIISIWKIRSTSKRRYWKIQRKVN